MQEHQKQQVRSLVEGDLPASLPRSCLRGQIGGSGEATGCCPRGVSALRLSAAVGCSGSSWGVSGVLASHCDGATVTAGMNGRGNVDAQHGTRDRSPLVGLFMPERWDAALAERAARLSTPAGNTGVETSWCKGLAPEVGAWWEEADLTPTIGVGWLRFTAFTDPSVLSRSAALAQLSDVGLGELRPLTSAARHYAHSWRALSSSVVSVRDRCPGEVNIDITQSDCEALGPVVLRDLLMWAGRQGRVNISRFDLNYDDYQSVIDPASVFDALNADQVVTHVQLWVKH